MEQTDKKYIAVAYELRSGDALAQTELIEKAPAERPYQFISGMGIALEAFEEKLTRLAGGERFDFVLPPAEAYGNYEPERVLELDKSMFCVDGRFNREEIYVGNYVPMVNDDGNRFEGLVTEVRDDTVVMDFNMRLAGKTLHFTGEIVEARPATDEEVKGLINRLSGNSCGCGGCNCEEACCCSADSENNAGGCGCGHCP